MKQIFVLLFVISSLFSVGQEKHDSLAFSLAYTVLRSAQEVGIAGDAGTSAEVIAFNIIYGSAFPSLKFKDVYQHSSIAGKFYCILGLYLLKDPEYEKYKSSFLSTKLEDEISFRAGSKRTKYKDLGKLLDIWIDGFSAKVWFTEALIIK